MIQDHSDHGASKAPISLSACHNTKKPQKVANNKNQEPIKSTQEFYITIVNPVTTLMKFSLSNRDVVSADGSSWSLEETGVYIKFSPKAVPAPKLITSSLWRPHTVLPPLKDNETLVSNVIELECNDTIGIDFSLVTVALSHSATDLGGYELVLKELIDSEDNVWKDLETWCPVGNLLST